MGGFGEQKVFSYVPGAEKLPEEKELEYDSADNEGWNDVSLEEEDGDVEIIPETEDEQKARIALAQQKSVARIFTDKDFETIRTHEALKEITPSGSKKSRAKKRVYADIDARDNKEIVPLNNIEGVVKCGDGTLAIFSRPSARRASTSLPSNCDITIASFSSSTSTPTEAMICLTCSFVGWAAPPRTASM